MSTLLSLLTAPSHQCALCDARAASAAELLQHTREKHAAELLEGVLRVLELREDQESQDDYMITARNKRPVHPVWAYFTRIDRYDAVCLLCRMRVRSACSTNLSRHVSRHHPESAIEVQRSWMRECGKRGDDRHTNDDVDVESVCLQECAEKGATGLAVGGVSSKGIQSAAGMNSGEGDSPACPVAIHPYGMSTMGGPMGPTGLMGPDQLAGLGLTPSLALANIDLSNAWCQFPGYHDLRPMDQVSYGAEFQLPINYHDISSAQKYDIYADVRPKEYEEARLFHKAAEAIATSTTSKDDDGAKSSDDRSETKSEGGATPAKRGRPTENPCWSYFIRLDDQNVRCRLCNKVVKSACATNMTKHLERHHQMDYQNLVVQIKQYRQQKGPTSMDAPMEGCVPSTEQNTNYVKVEPYDIYSTTTYDRPDIIRTYNTFEGQTVPPENITWQRSQWQQWSPLDPTTSNFENTANGTGVIQMHPNASSPPQGQSWPPNSPGGSARLTHATADKCEKMYMKRNRKTEHPVWEYFKRTSDGNAQCGICNGIVKSPCSSNFMRHLMRHHSIEYNNVYVKWIKKRENK